MRTDILSDAMETTTQTETLLKVQHKKGCKPRILYPIKISFREKGTNKTF